MEKKIKVDNDKSVVFYLKINELTLEVTIETYHRNPETFAQTLYSTKSLGVFSHEKIKELDQEKMGELLYEEYRLFIEKQKLLDELNTRMGDIKRVEINLE